MTVVRFPKAKKHSWREDGDINLADKDKLCWEICYYIRDTKPCNACPEWEMRRGERTKCLCRGMAEEVVNICQTGNLWRK